MELRLPLEMSPGREAACRAVFGTWGSFPDDARAGHCPFLLTSFTGWSSKRCLGIGFLPRGDREIGVLRNVEAPKRPRLECRRETGLILRCDRKFGNPFQTKQGCRPPEEIRRVEWAQRKWCWKTSGFLSRETGMPGNFVGRIKGAKYRFDLQFLTWDFSCDAVAGKGF